MRLTSLTAICLLGCNAGQDDTDTDTDLAGADLPWLDAGEPAIAPPDIPWLADGEPAVAPPARTCPTGWVEEPLATGGHVCSPWPSGARELCDDVLSVHLPGTAGCAPIDDACPSGDWPDDAIDTDTWFVAVDGSGDGSRAEPFGTIAEALAVASDGDTIQLGVGTFDGQVAIDKDLTLRGACAAQTTLTWSDVSNASKGVVDIDGATVTVRNLRISDAAAIGLKAADATVTVRDAVVDHVAGQGLRATDADVTLTRVHLADIAPRPSDDTAGDGLFAEGASTVTGTQVAVTRAHQAGLWFSGTSTFDLEGTVIAEMQPVAADLTRGVGIRSESPTGSNTARGLAIEDVYVYAVGTGNAAGATADYLLEDVWIRHILDDASDGDGPGAISHQGNGALTLRGLTADDVPQGAIWVSYIGDPALGSAVVTASDIVARHIRRSISAPFGGVGVVIYSSPNATLDRILTQDTEGDGMILDLGTVATVSDVRILSPGLLGGGRAGLSAWSAAQVTLTRAVLKSSPGVGLVVATDAQVDASQVLIDQLDAPLDEPASGAGLAAEDGNLTMSQSVIQNAAWIGVNVVGNASAVFEDTIVRDTRVHPLAGYGLAINVDTPDRLLPTSLTLRRSLIENAYGSAITGTTNFDLVAEDVTIRGIQSLESTGQFGFGIDHADGPTTLTRVAIRDVHVAGVFQEEGLLKMTDTVISGVGQAACVTDLCPEDTAATGVFVGNKAQATLDRVLLEGAAGTGLHVNGTGTVTDTVIRDNGVGLDAVKGDLTAESLTLTDNGTDRATTAQVPPKANW